MSDKGVQRFLRSRKVLILEEDTILTIMGDYGLLIYFLRVLLQFIQAVQQLSESNLQVTF